MARFARVSLYVCLLSSFLPVHSWAQVDTLEEDCRPRTYISYVDPPTRLTAAFYYPWYRATAGCPDGDWHRHAGA